MSCPCHTCLRFIDPACIMTMFWNKALHMDPHVSRLVRPVTEYSATQGSSNFSDQHFSGMDTTRLLFALKQGPRSLENHIREFLAFAHYSDLPDIILIEIFCDGINQPLRSQLRLEGPRSSLSCFLDFALLTVGSLFTSHSHITLQPKTGCPRKLSRAEPGQYLYGRPPGKTR